MPVTHTFVSAAPAVPGKVDSVAWNAVHTISIVDADVDPVAAITESKLSLNYPTHALVTIGTASGLSLVGQVLSLGMAASGVTGALSGTDWDTFNNKQSALTFPLVSTLGGTGVNNAGTLTNASNTTITGGGTLALAGFTLTIPATGTAALLATANVFTKDNYFPMATGDNTNVFVGGAGNFAMSGATRNTGIGSGALVSLTSGDENVALGYQAAYLTTTGSENLAFGTEALRQNVSGSYNVALGSTALRENDTGGSNMAIGRGSMYGVAGASVGWSRNVGVGYNTLRLISNTATDNVAIGYQAGYSVGGGIGNIFIGRSAGYNQVGVSSVFIVDYFNGTRANATAEIQNAYLYGSMANNGYLALNIPTTTNNAVREAYRAQVYVSNAAGANGLGVGYSFFAETATEGTYQQQGLISTSWIDATNASRKAKMSLSAYDTAARLGIEIEASGTVAKLGFYGVATVVRATNAVAAGAFVANTSGIVDDTATFGGYTLGQVVQALQNIGILT